MDMNINQNISKFNRSDAQQEHKLLLFNLKTTIEKLFLNYKSTDDSLSTKATSSSAVCSSWITSTIGILCLHTALEHIFLNGIRIFKPDKSPDLWRFIEGLNWLNPSMTISIANQHSVSPPIHIPYARIKNDKALCWIYENLDSNKLSQKLKYLISDSEHLTSCYEITAYFQNEKFSEALFLCLKAIETNQLNLLTQINPLLYGKSEVECFSSNEQHHQHHKRSTSHPDFTFISSTLQYQNIDYLIHQEECIDENSVKSSLNPSQLDRSVVSNMGNKYSSLTFDYNETASNYVSYSSNTIHDEKSPYCDDSNQKITDESVEYLPLKSSSPLASHGINSKTKKHKLHKKMKTKQLTNLKLRPWNSLPDLPTTPARSYIHNKTVSQSIHITNGKTKVTSENVSINQRQNVPLFSYAQGPSDSSSCNNTFDKQYKSSHRRNKLTKDQIKNRKPRVNNDDTIAGTSSSHTSGGGTTDLIPINLVKCDDIKIYFDTKYYPTPFNNHSSSTHQEHHQPQESSSNIDSVIEETLQNDNNSTIGKNFLTKQHHLLPLFNSITNPHYQKDEKEPNLVSMLLPSTSAPADFVNTFLPQDGTKIQHRNFTGKTSLFIDETSQQQQLQQQQQLEHQLEDHYYCRNSEKRPKQGQSLASFLQNSQFSHTNTDLERENAHFNVSEAMIAAIEQIKWKQFEKIKSRRKAELKQKFMNLKKKTKRKRQSDSINVNKCSLSLSSSPLSTASSLSSSNSSMESLSESDLSTSESTLSNGNMNDLRKLSVSSHSLNDHTAYAEWAENSIDAVSAESVALSLLSKFSDKQLPRASDLIWLVSEQDAPQQLLPMPCSWSVSPDEVYKIPFQRGTRDWAPPREQIIFTRHPIPDRKKLMLAQNQRCTGCGMRVAAAYSHRFRYCDYLGKYHCTGCHRNQISVIPARILDRWDFTCRPVSVFSYKLLEQIWSFPLFRVNDLNKQLYVRVKSLRLAKFKRNQLKYIQDFIVTCRFAERTKSLFHNISNHITSDTDIWSMSDFVNVRNGNFNKDISALIKECENHILQCELCTARGFICEICPKKDIIFPWQLKVKRCNDCGICYHDRCWVTDECLKCKRLRQRQLAIAVASSSSSSHRLN